MTGQLGRLHVLRRTLLGADVLTAALGLLALLLSLAGGLRGEDIRAPLTAAVVAALLHGALTDPRRWALPGAALLTGALLTPLGAEVHVKLLLGALGAAALSPVGLRGRAALTERIALTERAAVALLGEVQALHQQQRQLMRGIRQLQAQRAPLNSRMQALQAAHETHLEQVRALAGRAELSGPEVWTQAQALTVAFARLQAEHQPDILFAALTANLERMTALQQRWEERDAVLAERMQALERLIGQPA